MSYAILYESLTTSNSTICFQPDVSSCNTSLSRPFIFSHLCHNSTILPPWKHHYLFLLSSYTWFQYLPTPPKLAGITTYSNWFVTTSMLLARQYHLQLPHSSAWIRAELAMKTWHLNISPPLCHKFSQNFKTLKHSYTCVRFSLKETSPVWRYWRSDISVSSWIHVPKNQATMYLTMFSPKSTFYITQYTEILAMLSALFSFS